MYSVRHLPISAGNKSSLFSSKSKTLSFFNPPMVAGKRCTFTSNIHIMPCFIPAGNEQLAYKMPIKETQKGYSHDGQHDTQPPCNYLHVGQYHFLTHDLNL